METNETEVIDSTTDTEKTENQETTDEVVEEESVEVLKKKIDTLEAQKNHWREKAEKPRPSEKKEERVESSTVSLSTKDTIALVNAKINTEDFDTVVEWASFKKIPVADALKDKVLQTAIREKEEERQTAIATATKGGRMMTKDTPEEIVSRASKGILPDDDEGIAKLAEAQHALKMKSLQH